MPSYVIAGASRGIGLEFVVQLLARGDTVIALARNPESAKSLVAIKNDNLHILKADIMDAEALKAAAAETAKITGGALDVLVNNAAYLNNATAFVDVTQILDDASLLADFNTALSTNVIGPVLTTNAFLPLLKKGSLKKIITLSSGLGIPELTLKGGLSCQVAYSASKTALEMINVKYAVSLKDEGFTVLAISPGVVNTQEGVPSPEIMANIMKMFGIFKTLYPDWTGPIEATESVNLMLSVIDKATASEDNGKFVSHKGNQEWL